MRAMAIPPEIRARFAVAAARRRSGGRRARLRASSARRSARCRASGSPELLARLHGRNAFYTRKLEAAGVRAARCDFPATSGSCRSPPRRSSSPTRRRTRPGARRSPSRSTATRATARPRRRRAGRCGGSTPTRAGSGCSSAGRPSTAGRAWARRPHLFPFSFGPFLGFWAAFDAGSQIGALLRAGRRHVEPDAAGDVDERRRDRRLLHADLRAATGGGRRGARASSARREHRARADRGGRAGRQHSRDARADRAGAGARA